MRDAAAAIRLGLELSLWLVAGAWWVRALAAHRGLPSVPDLLNSQHHGSPAGTPSVTVIVPARNEQADIEACLRSLLIQDYPEIEIIAVNDRSTDQTGSVMDALAAEQPDRLRVLHLTELPAGWLGKSHAMSAAAETVQTDCILFTDADILFHPAAVRRALTNMTAEQADHFVLMPTTIVRRWDEGALLAFLQTFALWAARPWRVADPHARDAIGVGAFNLVRTQAYRAVGGFAAFPLEIIEDLGLARRLKQAGFRSRVAFGKDLVRVHWAAGIRGLINVMTKNIFSVFNFHPVLLLLSCAWLLAFSVAPFALLPVHGCTLPATLAIAAIAYAYVLIGRSSGLTPLYVLLAPVAALVLVYALLKSMVVTLRQGGVVWRGTFYPLAELRRHTVPLPWRPNRRKTS